MPYRLVLGVVVCLLMMPANVALAACEFSGRDVVYPGVFSAEWNSTPDIVAFNEAAGFPVTFGGTFHHLSEGRDNTYWILDGVWRASATPVAMVEVPVSAREMASGAHDDLIRQWAEGVAWWLGEHESHSVIIAPMQEMNGDWVPWGMDPANFKIAYRRFVEIFEEFGLDETQVRWMFAPNGVSVFPHSATDYWPGADVVDVVGISAYNFGQQFDEWRDVDDVLFDATEQLRAFARDKPFIISQIGTSNEGGDRQAWLSEMFDFVARHPNHIGFVYFNFDKETNWTVWDGGGVADGWLTALDSDSVRYQFPLDDWFRPGRIPFSWNPSTDYPKPSLLCVADRGEQTAYSDVTDGLFYSAPVEWATRTGLVTGYGDGTFRPDEPVTRAEALTMLWRAGCAPTGLTDAGFTDVEDAWYGDAINWGVATEIVAGYPDRTFRPDSAVTRADISTLIWRMHDCGNGSAAFEDVPVRSYFGGAVGWMAAAGITSGVAPDRFDPDEFVTRGELATFLFRMPLG